MRTVDLRKSKTAQKQVHYIPDAKLLNEYEIVGAIAKASQKKNVEYEIDGDELIEYSFSKGFFTRWIILNVKEHKVTLSSI